jgi:hypothetical protein
MQLAVAPVLTGLDVSIEMEMIRYKDSADKLGTIISAVQDVRKVHVGEEVSFRVRNVGSTTADVSLLFIDSQYGITALFPQRDADADARLERGAEITTPRFPVTDTTLGWEQLVGLAVAASNPRLDFRYLEQPSLDLATTRGQTILSSPLQQLINRSVFGAGTTRGLADREVGRHSIKMIAWRTEQNAP